MCVTMFLRFLIKCEKHWRRGTGHKVTQVLSQACSVYTPATKSHGHRALSQSRTSRGFFDDWLFTRPHCHAARADMNDVTYSHVCHVQSRMSRRVMYVTYSPMAPDYPESRRLILPAPASHVYLSQVAPRYSACYLQT